MQIYLEKYRSDEAKAVVRVGNPKRGELVECPVRMVKNRPTIFFKQQGYHIRQIGEVAFI
jgi:hypothetical protein